MRHQVHRDPAKRLAVPDLRETEPDGSVLHRQGPPAPVRRPEPRHATADPARDDQVRRVIESPTIFTAPGADPGCFFLGERPTSVGRWSFWSYTLRESGICTGPM